MLAAAALADLRHKLADNYSHTGRPSIDPELLIRHAYRRLLLWHSLQAAVCEEVEDRLTFRRFCRRQSPQGRRQVFDPRRRVTPAMACHAVKEYLATFDDAAFGVATEVTLKFVSPSDPAAQWTGAMKSAAFFAYADNYLIDVKAGIIVDQKLPRVDR